MKNLKILLFVLIGLGMFSACNNETVEQQKQYTISGEVNGSSEGIVFLKTRGDNGYETLDSAVLVDGKFSMTGDFDFPTISYLTSDFFKGGVPIFLEAASINVIMHKDSIKQAQVSGTESQKVYDEVIIDIAEIDEIWQDFYYNTYRYMTDEEKSRNEDHLNQIYDSAQVVKKEYLVNHLGLHNDNNSSPQLILEHEDALGTENMLIVFESLTPEVLESGPGQQLSKRIGVMKKTAIGQPLIDFIMNDTAGNPVKLSEATHGKYVLVDFWAAWCAPCRRENPNVVANYQKYHDKGFDVFGVSFDEKKDNWLKAISDDGLTWTQVSDLKGWKNAAGKLYGIHSIPQNIFLDKDGIIIGKNLKGEELGEKLKEIFGE